MTLMIVTLVIGSEHHVELSSVHVADYITADDYVALQQPAQGYLCGSLAIFLANMGEGRVGSGST